MPVLLLLNINLNGSELNRSYQEDMAVGDNALIVSASIGLKFLLKFRENMLKVSSVVHHENRCGGSSFWTTEAENKIAKACVPHGLSAVVTEDLGNEQI